MDDAVDRGCAPAGRDPRRPGRRPAPAGCSDVAGEPLPGTAKRARLLLALEHTRGWGRDILDGDALGPGLTARIRAWLGERDAELQFIRRPGRAGQDDSGGRRLYIAHCPPDQAGGARLERLTVAGPEALPGLDIRLGRATPGAHRVGQPLLLVCTHGKRDRCCAVKGRPMARALHNVHGDRVWETSHAKGHRFAPTMLLLPWNYSYGRMSVAEADAMLRAAAEHRLDPTGCRGRGLWGPRGQVAELAAREAAGAWGLDDVLAVDESPAAPVVRLRSGRRYAVPLEEVATPGVLGSCGDAPAVQRGWVAAGARPLPVSGASPAGPADCPGSGRPAR